jgi:hypothetical protein
MLAVLGCSLRQDHRIRTAHSLQKELYQRGEGDVRRWANFAIEQPMTEAD